MPPKRARIDEVTRRRLVNAILTPSPIEEPREKSALLVGGAILILVNVVILLVAWALR